MEAALADCTGDAAATVNPLANYNRRRISDVRARFCVLAFAKRQPVSARLWNFTRSLVNFPKFFRVRRKAAAVLRHFLPPWTDSPFNLPV